MLGPLLNVVPSQNLPADPRPLFWVTGVVLGLLALWVLYVVVTSPTRKPAEGESPSTPKPSSDGAE